MQQEQRVSEPPFVAKRCELRPGLWWICDNNNRRTAVGEKGHASFTQEQAEYLCEVLNKDHEKG